MDIPNQSTGSVQNTLTNPIDANLLPARAIQSVVSRIFFEGNDFVFGGGSLNYTCESETNRCTCKGIIDCDKMRDPKTGDCSGIIVCTDTGCWCEWK